MFRIRSRNKDALLRARTRDFEERLVEHLDHCFPDRVRALGATGLRDLVRRGTGRAAGRGMLSERDICKFIDLMLVFGEDFDVALPWARDVLDRPDPGPSSKVQELIRRGECALAGVRWTPPSSQG